MALRVVVVLACLALAQAKLLELSCKQVAAFVDGHNSRRLQVARGLVAGQPPAAEMKMMVWDDELAAKAAAWAAHDKFSHNPDNSVGSGRFVTGENLFWVGSTSRDGALLDPDKTVQAWFKEHKDFTFGDIQWAHFESGPMIGHYTQLVWANSTYLGCAASEFWAKDKKNLVVVCNYGPSGNWIGETPYKKAVRGRGVTKLSCDAGDACRHPYGKSCPKP